MVPPSIFLSKLLKKRRNKTFLEPNDLVKVELICKISFNTYFRIKFIDEFSITRTKLFYGNNWTKVFYTKHINNSNFSVEINNENYKKNEFFEISKKYYNDLVYQKKIILSGNKQFEGWFNI